MYLYDHYSPWLEWLDVAPLVYELHDYTLDPYMVRWPRLAWLALEQRELTDASSEIARLDSTIRAISLTHFHLGFLSELDLSALEIDYDDWLDGIVSIDEILLILSEKYDWPVNEFEALPQRIDQAFFEIYPTHMRQIVGALYAYFGSIQKIFDSLIETARPPGDPRLNIRQIGSAHDFMRGAIECLDDARLNDESDRIWT